MRQRRHQRGRRRPTTKQIAVPARDRERQAARLSPCRLPAQRPAAIAITSRPSRQGARVADALGPRAGPASQARPTDERHDRDDHAGGGKRQAELGLQCAGTMGGTMPSCPAAITPAAIRRKTCLHEVVVIVQQTRLLHAADPGDVTKRPRTGPRIRYSSDRALPARLANRAHSLCADERAGCARSNGQRAARKSRDGRASRH